LVPLLLIFLIHFKRDRTYILQISFNSCITCLSHLHNLSVHDICYRKMCLF
uniref:Ovule protein n=1 Tax=Brugia timori TaxID=42155 RepID=A0A0R3R4H1_9BILA